MRRVIRIAVFLLCPFFSFSQGKVVINEFMPWTSNTCGGPTAEFVELLNFGPGPVDIGCYILTDGDFSITIPPNTIVQPGAFYVVSGQDVIAGPCANIDSTITTNLNWNTCNCTSGAIPTTGDGLFTDGGSANEQVVLLSPSLTVVDAVIRNFPVEPSALITTSSLGGQCTPRTFDLDLMSINYETIGESAGRGNSFARKLDGDCGWVKDPQQSADATNNTPSEVSDVDYDFGITNSTACPANGSISIVVNASNYSNIFPMTYTLAYDRDHDYEFELTDSFATGTVTNPNTITVNNFRPGSYRITVESVLGCFLHTFPFVILDCNSVLSDPGISFQATKADRNISCQWSIQNSETADYIILEESENGQTFSSVKTIFRPSGINGIWSGGYTYRGNGSSSLIRLHVISKTGKHTFSRTVQLASENVSIQLWPNPVRDKIFISVINPEWSQRVIRYSIFNAMNQVVAGGEKIPDSPGLLSVPVSHLPSGFYQVLLQPANTDHDIRPVYLRFIKL